LKGINYKAEVIFVLDEGSNNMSAYEGIANQFGISLGSGNSNAFSGDNIIGLMNTKRMIEGVLLRDVEYLGNKTSLADLFIEMNDFKKNWDSKTYLKGISYPIGLTKEKLSLQQDSILGVLFKLIISDNLSVSKVSDKMSLISVNCTSSNQIFSKFFVEYLVEEVSRFYIKSKTQKIQSNLNILQNKADSVKNELNSAIYGRANLSDQNKYMVRQSAGVSGIKKEIDVQVLSTMYVELVKNLEITRLSLLRETPLIQIIDQPSLPLKKMKFRKIHGILYGGFLGIFIMAFVLICILLIKENFKKDDFKK
jgi:hypothetical protein